MFIEYGAACVCVCVRECVKYHRHQQKLMIQWIIMSMDCDDHSKSHCHVVQRGLCTDLN